MTSMIAILATNTTVVSVNMLLVGSKALEQYIDLGRVTHDWDIYMSSKEYEGFYLNFGNFLVKETKHSRLFEINGEIFEIKEESQFTPSDLELYKCFTTKRLETPIGTVKVPYIQFLYDLKKATANHIHEPKHKYDLELIEKWMPFFTTIRGESQFYKLRDQETKERIQKEKKVKYDFFHKYHIPEYVVHDDLHVIIADLLDIKIPTYQRITVAETEIAEECFNRLTYDQKISLMVEESLVLALERWFIPQMVEGGINYKLVDMFYNNNEAMPTYQILKHCNITGLKGEAEYITNFSRENFFAIEKSWQEAKTIIKSKNGFPSEFYNQLFGIRTKYKNGEKVALI